MTGDDLRWVAHLARLEFADAELAVFTEQLSRIVEYVDQLKAVDTDGVEPLAHGVPVHNVFRDDQLGASLSVDEALANAPNRKGEFYSVPAVFE
jgi:aspartyl-tRNA(Asn)/glutamyl-tRNA(Gln) amidotransferase subunit C